MILRKKPNVSLKLKYPLVMKSGLILSLLLLTVIMLALPKFSKNVTVQQQVQDIIEQEEVVITKVEIQQAAPPKKPSIPVQADDDEFVDDFDFEFENFDDYTAGDWAPPPSAPEDEDDGPRVRFIAYDEAPEPKGGFKAIQRNVIYPEIAKEAGIEGKVVIRAFIDKNGDVGECTVQQGIPNTGLNEAAINAIKKTKFKPAMQRDKPVGVYISIPVIFKLRN